MSTTTSPDSLFVPTGTDAVAPLHTVMANMQNSVQTALAKRQQKSYVWASATAMGAQTGMVAGDAGVRTDTMTPYLYSGTAWVATVSDTGWVNVTSLPSGFTAGAPVRYRKLNQVTFLDGMIYANAPADSSVLFTLGAGYRPDTSGGSIIFGTIPVWQGHVKITTAGAVSINGNTNRGSGQGYPINCSFIAAS